MPDKSEKQTGPAKQPKAKRVNYELIKRDDEPAMYELLKELIEGTHEHLTNARIALAWIKALKPNADGQLMLGRARKMSDLDREVAPYDFIILLNKEFWKETRVKAEQRKAILDHELSHCDVELDANDEPKRDEKDRVVYRIRRHDLEEFRGVVERNGIYKRDLADFAKTLRGRTAQTDLFDPSAE